ncbi:TrkH family potassium uptake protein [Paracoccus suum]|uniref:TrkH family potassium uptake protein n=1 Tax=Paracoccus suum TaxID=2259340 RepID=A0A344PNA3_9RHOB|nr:TrkH family potassium uptake protein [Paracoccus suum]AXC50858.1 TrkH family potassium uptake protein [Paracoccus suum]
MIRPTELPLMLLLAAVGAAAMLVPAVQAALMDDWRLARIFVTASAATGLVTAMLALANAANPRTGRLGRSHGGLASLAVTYALLPAALALPLAIALPDTGFLNAWWEMLSSLTTTGASLYDPRILPLPLHLWRGLVGWLGGLLILSAAVAILAPLQVGGFELVSAPLAASSGSDRRQASVAPRVGAARPAVEGDSWRIIRAAQSLMPIYGGVTLALWTGLTIAGGGGFSSLMRAMGTVSTSGIASVAGPVGAASGFAGEVLVAAGLALALSRRFWRGGDMLQTTRRLRDDPELRLSLAVVIFVTLAVLLRHMVAVAEEPATAAPHSAWWALGDVLRVSWGAAFTALSYLTTTGWISAEWQDAVTWSGLQEPGLILAGLAIIGGGAATTAGGVKLLRIAALIRHGSNEMERIVHPAAIAGGGPAWRRLRTVGAFLAFVSFMLFAVAIAVVMLLVTMQQVEFETAVALAVAALSNTGPLMQSVAVTPALSGGAGIAGAPWEGWAGLPGLTKAILAAAMVVGRLEIVAVLALFSPGYWRR